MAGIPDPFWTPEPARQITPVTRRDIFDYIRLEGGPWHGRMDEVAFLGRLYDLEALPSDDSLLRAPHTSDRSLNREPGRRAEIIETLKEARRSARLTSHDPVDV